MHVRHMAQHLVLACESVVIFALAATATRNGTPEDSLFNGMGPVVVSIEVVPTRECPFVAAGKGTVEDENVGFVDHLDVADTCGGSCLGF